MEQCSSIGAQGCAQCESKIRRNIKTFSETLLWHLDVTEHVRQQEASTHPVQSFTLKMIIVYSIEHWRSQSSNWSDYIRVECITRCLLLQAKIKGNADVFICMSAKFIIIASFNTFCSFNQRTCCFHQRARSFLRHNLGADPI